MLHYYCFAHERPRFVLDPRVVVIELGEDGASGVVGTNEVVRAYDLVPDLAPLHTWMGGSIANFAVLRHLKRVNAAPTDRVCISHYRRFLAPTQHGQDTPAEPDIGALSGEQGAKLDPYALAEQHPYPFLTAQPWANGFGANMSIRAQYARAHYVQDLDRYMTLATKLGIASKRDVRRYLRGKAFLPGGLEFTMSPVAVYCDVVQKLEDLNRAFLEKYPPTQRSDYQDRFLCYCNERLGSLLLFQALQQADVDPVACHGYMHIVSTTKKIEPGKWQPKAKTALRSAGTGRSCILHVGTDQTGTASLQIGLQGYDDGETIFAGNVFARGYPNNHELIAAALEQWEIDACVDYVDRRGQTGLDPRYHDCAWVLDDLRKVHRKVPQRDAIRDRFAKWLIDNPTPNVILSTQHLSKIPFAIPQLCTWLATHFDQIEVIGYRRPSAECFASALSQRLKSASHVRADMLWQQPLTQVVAPHDDTIRAFEDCLGQTAVTMVPYQSTDGSKIDVLQDFSGRFNVQFATGTSVTANSSLSAEAIAVLAAYVDASSPSGRDPAVFAHRMALCAVLQDFGTKRLIPSAELAGAFIATDDPENPISVIAQAPQSEQAVHVTTKADLLVLAQQQIEGLREHLARSWSCDIPTDIQTSDALGIFLDQLVQSNLRKQITTLVPAQFDGEAYLRLNQDVARAGADPVQHYLKHGYYEGRQIG